MQGNRNTAPGIGTGMWLQNIDEQGMARIYCIGQHNVKTYAHWLILLKHKMATHTDMAFGNTTRLLVAKMASPIHELGTDVLRRQTNRYIVFTGMDHN